MFTAPIQEGTRITESFVYIALRDIEMSKVSDSMQQELLRVKEFSGGERCQYMIGDPEVI